MEIIKSAIETLSAKYGQRAVALAMREVLRGWAAAAEAEVRKRAVPGAPGLRKLNYRRAVEHLQARSQARMPVPPGQGDPAPTGRDGDAAEKQTKTHNPRRRYITVDAERRHRYKKEIDRINRPRQPDQAGDSSKPAQNLAGRQGPHNHGLVLDTGLARDRQAGGEK